MNKNKLEFLDIGNNKKYKVYSNFKKKTINPKIKKLLTENKKIGLPDGFSIDKRNKTILRTKNNDGKVNADYRKAVMLRPNDIINNRQNNEIYSIGENKFYKRSDILVKDKQYLKQKYNKLGLKIKNGVVYNQIKSNFEKTPLMRKANGLKISRRYYITSKNVLVPSEDGEELIEEKQYDKERPTNIQNFVENIRDSYLRDFTPAQRERKNQSVLISFNSGTARWFPIASLTAENLAHRIDNYRDYYDHSGTDLSAIDDEDGNSPIGSDLIDFSNYRIQLIGSSKDMAGGANRENHNAKYFETNQPPTKNNECLEGAINRGLKLGKTSKTLRKLMASKYESILLGEMVSVYDLPKYEDEFKCRINLFEDRQHSENEIFISKKEYEKEINLLLSNEHYFLITGKKIVIDENIGTDLEKLDISKSKKPPTKRNNDLKEILVVFDIETVFNKMNDNYLDSYSVSWVVWDAEKEFVYNEDIHSKEPFCYYKRGKNCLRELINFLISPPVGIIYRPLGFNNSRFDNFAFCEEAIKMGVLRQSFFANGTILYAVVENTRPSWDTSRFLNGFSLDRACKSFNTTPKKATDLIDHYEIQTYYEKYGWDGLNKLLDTNDKLVLYNKIDCLCLLDLTLKIRKVFMGCNFDIFNSYTISSMGYKILEDKWSGRSEFLERTNKLTKKEISIEWKKHKPKFDVIRPKNFKDDSFFRASLFAGRTQSFYGAERELKSNATDEEIKSHREDRIIETDLAMVDYKSLYPTTLGSYGHQDYFYPYGDYLETDKEIPNFCGIYKCDIIHQKCEWKSPEIKHQFRLLKEKTGKDFYREFAPNVIPLRTKDKPLDWFYKGRMNDINLTSEDIRILRWATNDDKCVIVKNGYVWKKKSKELFVDYFDFFRLEKTKQDQLKKSLSKMKIEFPKQTDDFYVDKMVEEFGAMYSEAIRECMKLISNGVSGKLLEAIHEDIEDMFSQKKFLELEQDKNITELDIIDFGNNFSMIKGKKSAEAVFEKMKNKKPSYLGMFCYSFSRGLMYQTLLSRYICLYMDTDSACLPLFEYDRLNNSPHIIENDLVDNGEYGCLEEEVCDLKLCNKCEEREDRNDRNEIKEYRFNNPMKNGLRCSNCSIKPATKLIAISPKNYAVINSHSPKFDKRKFKGVRKNDFWLPLKDFGNYHYETKKVLGVDKKVCVGDGVDKVRGNILKYQLALNKNEKRPEPIIINGLDQEEIRQIREFKCCELCIDEVMAETGNSDFENTCSRCVEAKERVKKTYTDEMFEYLARGEKIVVFCSVINRIKYNIRDVVEWEYKDVLNSECSLETFELIVSNSRGNTSKNPIQMRFRTDEKESKKYFDDIEKAINDIKKKLGENKFTKSIKKQVFDYVNKQHRFNNVESCREVCESFKLKQTYMTKII
tara:strand:+ start:2231 stop:6430 length:4200 start_codon:yes stop_codon:yes gene_type:complete